MVLRVHCSAGWQVHFSTFTSSAGRNSNFNTKNQTGVSRLLPWECPRGGGQSRSWSQPRHLVSRSHPALLGGSKSPRDSGCLERQVLKPVETGRGALSRPALCSGSRGGVGGRHPAPSRPGGGACGCRGGREAGRPARTIARPCPTGLHVFPTFVLYELTVLLVLTPSVVVMKVGPLLAKSMLPLVSPVTPSPSLPACVYPPPSAARAAGASWIGMALCLRVCVENGVGVLQ